MNQEKEIRIPEKIIDSLIEHGGEGSGSLQEIISDIRKLAEDSDPIKFKTHRYPDGKRSK